MSQISLKTIKTSENKWWIKLPVIFSLFIVSQFYTIHHKIEHLKEATNTVCVQCVLSADYLDSAHNEIIELDSLTQFHYQLNLNQSIPRLAPDFYFSRAPPLI